MRIIYLCIFMLVLPVTGLCDYHFPDNWETVKHEGFSWEDYEFKNSEVLLVVFRARDCMGCIKSVMQKINADGKRFVGIAGYMKEAELFGINTVLKGYGDSILRDRKFTLIRALKLRKTPVILLLNSKLEYRVADLNMSRKYTGEQIW